MSYDDLPYFRDQILERIDSLKCFLSNTPLMANLMTVSTVSRTEERLKQVKPIRVSVKDDASVEEIIQALTDICVDDIESLSHDSTKVTTKYPGLIIVPERADLLESLITSINEAKNDFAAAMRRVSIIKRMSVLIKCTRSSRALSLCTQQEMSFSSSPSLKSYFFMAAKPKPRKLKQQSNL